MPILTQMLQNWIMTEGIALEDLGGRNGDSIGWRITNNDSFTLHKRITYKVEENREQMRKGSVYLFETN